VTWLASEAEHYTIDVLDPETGDRATVTCKRLTAADHAKVQDAQFDEERGEGHARFVIVSHAVVSWTIPVGPYSPDMLAAIDPSVFLQIYAGIRSEDVSPFAQAARAIVELRKEAEASPPQESPAPADAASDAAE